MDKKKFEIIKNLIEDLGGFEVIESTNETPQKFISFKQIVKKTTLNIYLFYEISNDEVFFRIFTTYYTAYENPSSDFHMIISKLNLKSIWGALVVTKEDDNYYYVSYKSNILIKTKDLIDNKKQFNLFLSASMAMINMHYSELH